MSRPAWATKDPVANNAKKSQERNDSERPGVGSRERQVGLGLSCMLEVEFCVINIMLASLTIIEWVHIQLSRKTTQSNQ